MKTQCYQEVIEWIDYFQDIVWDNSVQYLEMENQFDLIFLDNEITPKIYQPLTYPIGYQYDGTYKEVKND